jgi:hypothetical protein
MDLSNILSIRGKNGLFKLITQGKTNFIVESLEDKKRFPAFQSEGISTLNNISIYTNDDSVELGKVFQAIYKKYEAQPLGYDALTNDQLRALFKEVLPNYDEDKVFISNIKTIFQWYNILLKNELILLDDSETEAEVEKTDETES